MWFPISANAGRKVNLDPSNAGPYERCLCAERRDREQRARLRPSARDQVKRHTVISDDGKTKTLKRSAQCRRKPCGVIGILPQ